MRHRDRIKKMSNRVFEQCRATFDATKSRRLLDPPAASRMGLFLAFLKSFLSHIFAWEARLSLSGCGDKRGAPGRGLRTAPISPETRIFAHDNGFVFAFSRIIRTPAVGSFSNPRLVILIDWLCNGTLPLSLEPVEAVL